MVRSIFDSLVVVTKLIGLAVFSVAGISLLLFFGMWIVIALVVGMAVFVAMWSIGTPITIRAAGVKKGYIRWFTFYPETDSRIK